MVHKLCNLRQTSHPKTSFQKELVSPTSNSFPSLLQKDSDFIKIIGHKVSHKCTMRVIIVAPLKHCVSLK